MNTLIAAFVLIVSGWLYIPALGLAEPIYESQIGADGLHAIPAADVVHLSGTAWLNTTYAELVANGGGVASAGSDYPAGTIALAGHNPGVFSGLSTLQAGDDLYVAEWPVLVKFRVVGVHTVPVSDTSWLAPATDEQRLIVIACMGDQRLIIEAARVE